MNHGTSERLSNRCSFITCIGKVIIASAVTIVNQGVPLLPKEHTLLASGDIPGCHQGILEGKMTTIPLMLDDDLESGGKERDIENDFAYRNNVSQASLNIRLGFLRKVYSLVFMQLFVSAAFTFCLYTWVEGHAFVQENDWLLSVAFLLSVITLIALHIKRKDTPINYVLLAIFTVVQAYSIGVVVSYFETVVVLQALFLTLAVVGGLTLYTFQTKNDFSYLGTILFTGLCILLIAGITQFFIQNSTFEIIVSIFGAFVFSLFIVYDTQNIMLRLSPEEYILATITLYLDIVNLFLYILRALEVVRRG